MILLDRLWRRPRSLEPWLPLLCVAWASLHGVEYPVLLVVVAIHGLAALLPRAREPLGTLVRDRDVWRWPALFVLCAAAFALNPFGVRVFATALMGLDGEATRHLQEFQPLPWRALLDLAPDLSLSPASLAAYATVFVLAALPQWIRRRDGSRPPPLRGDRALALARARFLLEFALLVLPFAGEALAALRREPGVRARLGTAVVAGVGAVVLLAVGVNAWSALRQGRYTPLSATAYPIGPVRFLDGAGLQGNFFVDADASGYVEWALHPHVRVFMDLRTPEPFDGETLWLYRQVAFATDVEPLARVEARWPLDGVLLRRQAGLGRALAGDPADRFELAYADDQFVLFLHQRVLRERTIIPPLRVLDPFDTTVGYVAGLPPAARDALRAEVALLLQVWPANHLAHQTDLALLAQAGDPARTYERASRLMAEFPGEARYPYAAGMALRALDRDAAAFEAFQRALRLDPGFGVAAVAAAETALRLGRHDDGRAIMERELERQARPAERRGIPAAGRSPVSQRPPPGGGAGLRAGAVAARRRSVARRGREQPGERLPRPRDARAGAESPGGGAGAGAGVSRGRVQPRAGLGPHRAGRRGAAGVPPARRGRRGCRPTSARAPGPAWRRPGPPSDATSG